MDNTAGSYTRRAIFGYVRTDPYYALRHLNDTQSGLEGVAYGRQFAIASKDADVHSAVGTGINTLLEEEHVDNWKGGLGATALMIMEVPAGERRTYRFAVSFYRGGLMTTGLDATYYYARYFQSVEEVAAYTLERYDTLRASMLEGGKLTEVPHLTEDQRWMLNHAIRSYYNSTQLFDHGGEPLWVVNEGEYKMINTFDLTVDHLFYEMKMNPWVVKNTLDLFVDRYSYEDKVGLPGEEAVYPGGISFTHDMGKINSFWKPGYSSYERMGYEGCFSYMTHEQLTNWVCCATVYVARTKDQEWAEKRLPVFRACLESMVNRDHYDPAQRDGLMSLESSRTRGGAEITTYDSLDTSLGQARNNIYLGSKSWASYVALAKLFREAGEPELAAQAEDQALRCSRTITAHATAEGWIPAVLEGDHPSRIIPAIEGLVFVYMIGNADALQPDGPYGEYIQALKRHLETVLVRGICLFEDGGWKLSSTSINSWLSKVYLCQFIARHILGLPQDEALLRADSTHVEWLLHPELSYWCWSDQIISGRITGSKYYPRGVTSILWLEEGKLA